MKKLIGLMSASLLGLPIVASAAVDGRICFETRSKLVGAPTVYSDYRITYQKGEVATISGQVCFKHPTLQGDECMAATGNIQFHNGIMEIDGTASNKVTLPDLGEVYSMVHGYTELASGSLEGHGSALITNVVNGVPTTIFSPDGVARAVACPKPTAEDKENIKLRNKMLRELDAL